MLSRNFRMPVQEGKDIQGHLDSRNTGYLFAEGEGHSVQTNMLKPVPCGYTMLHL